MLSGTEKYNRLKSLLPLQKYGQIFRLVDESDADFIFMLRTDPKLSRYLNKVSSNIIDQIRWITEYKNRELNGEEFYFISINPETGERQGVSRIYNFRDDIYELGSWIYLPDTDISKSILGDIAVREIAYDYLQFNICTFEVRKENKTVIRYHMGYSPEKIGEDELNYYFRLTKFTFNNNKYKYLKIFGYGYD